MIKLAGIYTIRDTSQPYYWDIVFDWEDQISKTLAIPLISVGRRFDRIYKPDLSRKILNRLAIYKKLDEKFFTPSKYYLAFHIGPPGVYSFHCRKDVIPIIIDFWKHENLKRLESILALNEIVFISSREVFEFLLQENTTLRLAHLGLSLPDKLLSPSKDILKTYDLIQFGRQNEKMAEYVSRLLRDHPRIHYVYAENIEGKVNMISNHHGTLGEFLSRQSFLNLLMKTRISLLSAPGLDKDRVRTGGFSPVTPRFLESAACGCHLIGIYPQNSDFDYFDINSVCSQPSDYESFERLVLKLLSEKNPPDHSSFLRRHVTSLRAVELLKKISSSNE
ncbi:MAG: hypothetical protein WKF87_11025 [Chryseolinea sp.]